MKHCVKTDFKIEFSIYLVIAQILTRLEGAHIQQCLVSVANYKLNFGPTFTSLRPPHHVFNLHE